MVPDLALLEPPCGLVQPGDRPGEVGGDDLGVFRCIVLFRADARHDAGGVDDQVQAAQIARDRLEQSRDSAP